MMCLTLSASLSSACEMVPELSVSKCWNARYMFSSICGQPVCLSRNAELMQTGSQWPFCQNDVSNSLNNHRQEGKDL